ncbi:hypothetical protein [Pyxidicoccus caerfyrddinensis]|uniref:hypothetical protein n=1 Tax=Pyxidicoccus caerfyrddinensis TaxID=2709663 RepID=UPI0013D9B291|nr:hypothetical protein [Pyxidicoccus caerfyrddinensis]
MVARRWWALLLIPLAVGCASPRVVRLDTGNGRPLEHMPRTSGGSVEDALERTGATGMKFIEV